MNDNRIYIVDALEEKIRELPEQQILEINRYFELIREKGDDPTQVDLFSEDKEYYDKHKKAINNIQIILDKALDVLFNQIIEDKEKVKHQQLANRINQAKKNNSNCTHAYIANKINVHPSRISEYKNSVLNGGKIKNSKLYAPINELLNELECDTNIVSLDEKHIAKYYEDQLENDIAPLSEDDKKNLCGTYLFFCRSNFYAMGSARDIRISKMRIYLNQNDSNIRYQLFSRSSEGTTLVSEGYIIRNTSSMLILCGIKKSSKKVYGLEKMSLSINEISRLVQNNGMKYINGSISTYEEGLGKPYSTWIHLSKVENNEALENDEEINCEETDFPNYSEKVFFMKISIDNFISGHKELKKLEKHIVGNYPDYKQFEDIVPYIYKKLELDRKGVNHQI